MRFLSIIIAALSFAAGVSTSAKATVLLDDNFDDLVGSAYTLDQVWHDQETHGNWYVNFLGFGTGAVKNADDSYLEIQPCDVDVCGGNPPTHAPLVTSTAANSGGDLSVELRMKTVSQLRNVSPNPWEVAWVMWNVQLDANGFITWANYFILKTNGWELGVLRNGQHFLATGTTPTLGILNNWKEVNIYQVAGANGHDDIDVYINTNTHIDLNGASSGYSFHDTTDTLSKTGKLVGLYNEDSVTRFDDVLISRP